MVISGRQCWETTTYASWWIMKMQKMHFLVSILRGGREVARGKVMRSQPGACTVLVEAGEVLRFDVVMLLKPVAAPSDRGPSIPCAIAPTRAKTLAPVAKADKKDFWSTLNTSGRVYQLNTGQMLTP